MEKAQIHSTIQPSKTSASTTLSPQQQNLPRPASIFTTAAIRRNYIIYETLRGLEKKIYIIKHNLEYHQIASASYSNQPTNETT